MIRFLFRQVGRHPMVCLIPVFALAALAGAEFLVFKFTAGEKEFLSARMSTYAASLLVLATLALLAVALAWWVRNQLVAQLDRLHAAMTEIRILVVPRPTLSPRVRFTQQQPEPPRDDPVWRQNTAAYGQIRGHVYGSAPAAVEQGGGPELDRWDQVVRDYNASPREDTGDVTPPELRSS